MKNPSPLISIRQIIAFALIVLFPVLGFAEDATAAQLDLKEHFIGYFTVAFTVIAYAFAMTEDLHQMSKAKPMVLGFGIIWFAIFIYYSLEFGGAKKCCCNRPPIHRLRANG